MGVDENLWKFMQTHLGYDDEEMEEFRKNPRNLDVLAKASKLMNKTTLLRLWNPKTAIANIELETGSFLMVQATC